MELKKYIKIIIDDVINPSLGDDCKIELYGIKTKQFIWGKVVDIFVDSDCFENMDDSEKDEVRKQIKTSMSLLGIDNDLIEIYLNQRPLTPLDEENLPFSENINDNNRVRTFSKNVLSEDLKWHTDEQDRIIIPMNNSNWKLQLDNELPVELKKGKKYFIPEGVYHRVIKGNQDLKLKVIFK